VPYIFSARFFLHFTKIFLVTSPPHCTHHLQSFEVAVVELRAKYTVAQND
jgi:hypothetical protein